MSVYYERVIRAKESILKQSNGFIPSLGIITGTGLGEITSDFEILHSIPYSQIDGFPVSTVQSHKGELILCKYKGLNVVVLSGRLHYYEGYSMQEVTLPVRVLKELGIDKLIISNVTGGINESYEMGDVVFIGDHINLMPENPLRGKNQDQWGPRFPDMKNVYNPVWNKKGIEIAKKLGLKAHQGVYTAVQGPNLETSSEIIHIHKIGGDVVGMSTVPEVIVAKHMELPVLVFSLVSNKSYPPSEIEETTVEDVIAVGKEKSPLLRKMVLHLIDMLQETH